MIVAMIASLEPSTPPESRRRQEPQQVLRELEQEWVPKVRPQRL